ATLGVGAYVSTSPYTLPAATLTDLANLTVVPPRTVILEGPGIINELEALITKWHPKYALFIQPDGTIRIVNIFTLPAQTLVVPGETGSSDPLTWPNFTSSIDGCYTAVQAIGKDIQMAVLRVSDGTLIAGWSGTDQSTWTINDYLQPKDGYDWGTITALTTTQATVKSHDTSVTWSTNFWQTRIGHITLVDTASSGIQMMENRTVTACAAMTAGGTATVSWDASLPLPGLSYSSYILIATAGSKVDVGRLYLVREPHTGATGTSTFIGPRLLPASPRPLAFANNGRTANSVLGSAAGGLTSGPVAQVIWSSTGNAPYMAYPVTLQVVPSVGGVRFDEPDVRATSLMSTLQTGYPTTYANGKPVDIVVMCPYNRGDLTTRKPASGYSGTAYSVDGLQRVLTLFIDDWTYEADTTNIAQLCQEHLDTVQDIVWEGSVTYRGYPSFNPLAMGYSLSLSIAGASAPWDSVNHPVRTATVRWNPGEGLLHCVDFSVSNKKRPFSGDELYIHPAAFGQGAQGGQMPFANAVTGTPQSFTGMLPQADQSSIVFGDLETISSFPSKQPSVAATAAAGAVLGAAAIGPPGPKAELAADFVGPPALSGQRQLSSTDQGFVGPPKPSAKPNSLGPGSRLVGPVKPSAAEAVHEATIDNPPVRSDQKFPFGPAGRFVGPPAPRFPKKLASNENGGTGDVE
ncbi:MAG: hypothetical protein KGL39_56365, partial [Patescibacteria group bacterium]|nr:hypothetical protein [Patescibacteria group bacterium]